MDVITSRLAPPWRDFFRRGVSPDLLAFGQSVIGRCLLVGLFSALLPLLTPTYPFVVFIIVFCTLLPEHRWRILGGTTLALFALHPFWANPDLPKLAATREGLAETYNLAPLRMGAAASFLAMALGLLFARKRAGPRFVFTRPLLFLLGLFFSVLIIADRHVLHGAPQVFLWCFISLFSGYFWFLAYALTDPQIAGRPLARSLASFHTFWGSSSVPIGKGVANLARLEATDDAALIVSQIKGLRLIINTALIFGTRVAFVALVHRWLGVPNFNDLFVRQAAGAPYPPSLCWLSLLAAFFETVMATALFGNTIVACARMSGFPILCNTYKPLRAQTIVEFWNRFYFYFKELLVDFFFYPAFFRYFKKHRRLRLIFATFMAATVGNVLFHFMRDISWVLRIGLWPSLLGMQTYLFYSLVLTAGICASQLRPRAARRDVARHQRILPAVTVIGFFCLLHIFDDAPGRRTMANSTHFLLHLFGIG